MQPVIGITTSFEQGELRIHPAYAAAVERAGGLPVLIPTYTNRDSLYRLLDLIDGVIIPGGPAVENGLIGVLPEDISAPAPERVRNDGWVLERVLEMKLPVLGICYGMQLLNAYHGGTIYADVERQCELPISHSEKRGGRDHKMTLETGTWLHRILGQHSITVNTRHIQAIANVGQALRVSGRSPDGVIEAIESDDGTLIGVQFHAERMEESMRPLFEHLIALSTVT